MSRCSCFVVGEGAITLECLEIPVKTQDILGVYSPNRSLFTWAEAREIAHPPSRSQFESLLLTSEYDYLFSINNGWIIPEAVLNQARRRTINYHNSPLPKYAGVHATTWAMIHGETEHAITWHEVVAEVDAGRILKQVKFPILPNDTALSVNTRCAEAAIAAFAELVNKLASDRVTPVKQDLSQRSYFGLSDRPAAAAVLDWRQSTQTLHNLIRALNFAPIENAIALPKLWLPGGVVAVTQSRSMPIPDPQAGKVLNLSSAGLQVATADGSLWLSGLITLNGVPLSEVDLIKRSPALRNWVVMPSMSARYPSLKNQPKALSVGILLADSPNTLKLQDAALTWVVYRDGRPPELIHSGAIDPASAEAIAEQLQVFITACYERSDQPLQSLPLQSSAQMQQMLFQWNNTATAYPSRCIHELIADQATRTPDAIAVEAETHLSYRELDRRSNQLAH